MSVSLRRWCHAVFALFLTVGVSPAFAAEALPSSSQPLGATNTTTDYVQYLIKNQAPVISAAFGPGYASGIHCLELGETPNLLQMTPGLGPNDLPFEWVPAMRSDIDYLNEPDLPAAHLQSLLSLQADMSLTVGTLRGPMGSVDCLGMSFSAIDSVGVRRYRLVPVAAAPKGMVETLREYAVDLELGSGLKSGLTSLSSQKVTDIDDYGYCHETYRKRLAKALKKFTKCMADNAPPISIWNVACFVACVPLLAGTPIAYAICVAACNAGVAAGTVIDTVTCVEQLKSARASALASYCWCIDNTSSGEIDIVGCDDGPTPKKL
jgi:hypothetical protein